MYGGPAPLLPSAPIANRALFLAFRAEGDAEGNGVLTAIAPAACPSAAVHTRSSGHVVPLAVPHPTEHVRS